MANAEADGPAGRGERWVASWDSVRQAQLEAGLAATAEQRLAWLEDAMRLAEASGALAARRDRSVRPPVSSIEHEVHRLVHQLEHRAPLYT